MLASNTTGRKDSMGLGYTFKDGDWARLRQIIQKIASIEFGPDSVPTFGGLTLTGLTASRLIASDASDALESTDLIDWVAGTANRITVADDGDGTITLSTPQNIDTSADVTFDSLTLDDLNVAGGVVYHAGGGLLADSANLTFDGTNLDVAGTGDFGTLKIGSGSITDSSGAISFGNENLSSTGTGSLAALTLSNVTFTATYGFIYNLPSITAASTTALGMAWMCPTTGTSTEGTFRFINRANNLVAPTVFENLVLNYSTGGGQWRIFTQLFGSGTGYSVRPLVIYTGSNLYQLLLNIDGSVSMNTGSFDVSAGDIKIHRGELYVSNGSIYCQKIIPLDGTLVIGDAEAGTDHALKFDGQSSDGTLQWMEDEDYFKFLDDVLMNGTERIYFNDTNTSLVYANSGDLDLYTPANKTLELQTAVYQDLNISGALLVGNPTATPGTDQYKDSTGADVGIETYAFAVDEGVHGGFELQHDYKEGTNLVFHVHWQGIAAPTGTDNVQWRITYIVARDDTVLSAATTIDSPDTAIDTQYKNYRTDFSAITGTNFKIGDQFMFSLFRVAATGDAYAGDALIYTAGVHYQIDTLGSRQIGTK